MAADKQIYPSATNHLETSGSSASVHPKILKRPPQFSSRLRQESAAPDNMRITQDEPPEPPPTIMPLAWQNDGRFAVTLLAIIIVMNIALSYWLAQISTRPHNSRPATTDETGIVHLLDSVAPAVVTQ